jgi:hypothetical protein
MSNKKPTSGLTIRLACAELRRKCFDCGPISWALRVLVRPHQDGLSPDGEISGLLGTQTVAINQSQQGKAIRQTLHIPVRLRAIPPRPSATDRMVNGADAKALVDVVQNGAIIVAQTEAEITAPATRIGLTGDAEAAFAVNESHEPGTERWIKSERQRRWLSGCKTTALAKVVGATIGLDLKFITRDIKATFVAQQTATLGRQNRGPFTVMHGSQSLTRLRVTSSAAS